MFLIYSLTSWYLTRARRNNSVLLRQGDKFLLGKLQNSVSLLHNSKQSTGNAFYSSCLWTPWEIREFPVGPTKLGNISEAFLWLGWMASNTCFGNFPSPNHFCCAVCHGTLGIEQTIFHVLALTPSCQGSTILAGLGVGLLQPTPMWWDGSRCLQFS